MDNGDAIALQLQFREHTTPAAPPDVDAFRRPRRATRPALAPEELGVLPPTRARARERGGFVVFFQHPEFGIPAPGHLYALIDLTSWSPRLTMLGYAANIRPSREEPGLLRAAGVLAACLTLAIPFDVAAAPAPGDDVVASAADGPRDAETPTAIEADVPSPPQPAPIEGERATASPEAPRPPSAVATGGAVNPELIDAAWEGVDGFNVVLELKGGSSLRGYVGAVQRDTFTLIEADTGKVRVLPKSGVKSLRVFVAPPAPTKTGMGLLVGGGLLTGTGTPVFLTGIVFLGLCPSCTYLHIPMWLVGGAALGAGIPMLVKGAQRREAYREAMNRRAVTPLVSRTQHGWTGGLAFRF